MLRNIDDWAGAHFAFQADGPQDGPKTVVEAVHGLQGLTVTIPDAHLLFNAEFSRVGSDLILRGDDGKVVVVHDYFVPDHRAPLLSPDGAALSPEVVAALAGPMAPGQYAQAGATQNQVQAVGRVVAASGNVSIMRNGVAITLNVGDAVLKGDVLQTGDGTLGVTFNDGSTLNLTAHSRLVVNEFLYDSHGTNNSEILSLVQGSLTFISGHVAHSGDMKITTPVATLGIRGTVGGMTEAADGTVSVFIAESATGAVLTDNAGNILAHVVQNGPLILIRPAGPLNVLAEEVNKTQDELARELAVVQHLVNLQSVGEQIIQQYLQPPNPNNPQTPSGTPHTQIQIQIPTNFVSNGDTTGTGTPTSTTVPVQVSTVDHGTTSPPQTYDVTVPADTTPPNAPTFSITSGDTTLANGSTTNNPTPTVHVLLGGTNAVAGDTVTLFDGNVAIGSPVTLTAADVANGYVDIVAPGLSNGVTYHLNVSVTDASGNTSPPSNDIALTIDTQAPDAPTVALAHDTGGSASDAITNNGTLAVTAAEPGGTVQYSIDGGAHWTSSFTAVEGFNTVEVRQVDAAGNDGAPTTFSFTLDTQAPTAPTVALTKDTGSSNSDGITDNGTLAVTPAEPGGTVQYSIDGGAHWTTSFTAVEGLNTVEVRQVDAAGNEGAATTFNFTLDTQAPNAPTVGLSNDTGPSNSDHVTSDGTLAVTPAENGGTLQYSIDGGETWTTNFTAAEGANSVEVRQVDAAGNEGAATTFNFTLDTQAPNAPTVGLSNDTGSSNSDHITSDGTLAVTQAENGRHGAIFHRQRTALDHHLSPPSRA